MKKYLILGLAILSCGFVNALPVGNPAEASLLCDGLFWEGSCCLDFCDPCVSWCEMWSLRMGYYGDFVYNRHLQTRDSDLEDGVVEHAEIYTNAAYLVFNVWDRLDVFATLGASHIIWESNGNVFAAMATSERLVFESETDFSWSVGLRGTVWECGCTSIGLEAQYFQTCPDIKRGTAFETQSLYPDDLQMKYHEWQIGFGIAHRVNMFVPYAAVKWSRVRIDMDNAFLAGPGVTLFDLENDKDWGYAIGVSLVGCEKNALTAEARFGDEKALYVNWQFRF